MEFARLARTFEELERTSSRLALIALVTELFRSIERPDEIEKVCYATRCAFRGSSHSGSETKSRKTRRPYRS